jgi:hypothetical protein
MWRVGSRKRWGGEEEGATETPLEARHTLQQLGLRDG